MLEFQQAMLQGLPISTVSNVPAQQSALGNITSTVGGLTQLQDALEKLGIKL